MAPKQPKYTRIVKRGEEFFLILIKTGAVLDIYTDQLKARQMQNEVEGSLDGSIVPERPTEDT